MGNELIGEFDNSEQGIGIGPDFVRVVHEVAEESFLRGLDEGHKVAMAKVAEALIDVARSVDDVASETGDSANSDTRSRLDGQRASLELLTLKLRDTFKTNEGPSGT